MALGLRQRAAIGRPGSDLRDAIGGAPSIIPAKSEFNDSAAPDLGPELDCVRGLLPDELLAAAERRAIAIGVSADRVLIAAGTLNEEVYLRALAADLGMRFELLDGVRRASCPLPDERLIESAAAGLLPLAGGDIGPTLVIAPRDTRRMIGMIQDKPELAGRFSLTTSERLHQFVFRHAGQKIGDRASHALHRSWPELSAAPPRWRHSIAPAVITGALALAAFLIAPGHATVAFEVMLALVFLGWMILRLAGTLVNRPASAASAPIRDDELPVYTVMCALYREAAAVEGLIAAIRQIDYPPEKLDVKIIIETDDAETQQALARLDPGPPFEIIVSPDVGPRTKPKALNAALPFARGSFVVIYDAEDRPEPDQLHRALDAFFTQGDDLACVQACLTIDNTADNWITALFTAEYAGQFDVFLPALAALGMPLPLGGSSNHFRAAILREVGAWDPYNVTEDADLGMRLARFGYRSSVIEPTTYEEAPARFGAWLRQRTRWFKGWMQTWLVHMREPRRLMRDLGLPAFLTFQLMVGGNALAALVHPLFIIWFFSALWSDGPFWASQGTAALFGFTVVVGYVTSAFLGWIGLLRRGLLRTSWVLILMPVHWLLLSLAAWRALYQLVREPYRWEKTDHGLARTSRLAWRWTSIAATPAVQGSSPVPSPRLAPFSLDWLELESLLLTYNAANRPPRPRVSA